MPNSPSSPKPPAGLSPAARDIWRDIFTSFEFDNRGDLELLSQFVYLLDRLTMLRASISKSGMTIPGSRKQTRPNPLLAAERDTVRSLLAVHRALRLQGATEF